MDKMGVCLWFDHQGEQAVEFYKSVFPSLSVKSKAHYGPAAAKMSGQKEGALMTVYFNIRDLEVLALNAGPIFNFSPSFSFTVGFKDEKELDSAWKKLSQDGKVLMGLDKYPWAEKYGWTADKFGVDWQLTLNPQSEKITPSLLFVDELFGKGEEAIQFYTSIFPNSKINSMVKDEKTKTVMHCEFELEGRAVSLMEGQGKHGHKFTHAHSFMINCKDQKEIDYYWDKLSAGGKTEPCGWLQDKYGISWQVSPAILAEFHGDPKKSEKVMAAMNGMKKLDMEKLVRAANG